MSDSVKIKIQKGLGVITLNRPQALNALSLEMIMAMRSALSDFENDDNVQAVMVTSASEKAFCAGGDVKSVALEAKRMQDGAKDADLCEQIFYHEYNLNTQIHDLKKPYISFIDGICMGGGMGISQHGSHCIVSEKTTFAMPEVFIGFFPDVGSGHIFNRLQAGVGEWLLLSGARINGADMLHLGLADYYIESRGMQALQKSLLNSDWERAEPVSILVSQLSTYCEEKVMVKSDIVDHIDVMADIFSGDDVRNIMHKMKKSDSEIVSEALKRMKSACPLSMHLTLSHLRQVNGMDFRDIMQREYRLSQYFMKQPEFYEGVRAVLIEKSNDADWQRGFDDLDDHLYEDIQNAYSSLSLYE